MNKQLSILFTLLVVAAPVIAVKDMALVYKPDPTSLVDMGGGIFYDEEKDMHFCQVDSR